MKRANPRGYGAPHIRIWGPSNQILTENIDKFRYRYLEEEPDRCEVTFKTNNRYIRDEEPFQADAKWKVQWGYLPTPEFPAGLYSPIRTVYVREISTTYDDKNITLQIIATDGASYLSQIDPRGASGLYQRVTFGDVVRNFTEQLGLTIKVDTDAFIDGNGKLQIRGTRTGGLTEDIKLANFLNKIRLADRGGDLTHAGGTADGMKPLSVKELPETFVLYEDMFAGVSMWQTIKDLLIKEAVPGLSLSSRDNDLIITQRNLNKKPIHTYPYDPNADGELLMFRPEEKRYKVSKTRNYSIEVHDRLNKITKVKHVTSDELYGRVYLENLAKSNPNIITAEQFEVYQQFVSSVDSTGQRYIMKPELYKFISNQVNTIPEGCEITLVAVPLDNRGNKIDPKPKAGTNIVPNFQFSGFYEAYIEIKGNREQTRQGPITKKTEDATVLKNLIDKKSLGNLVSPAYVDNTSVPTQKAMIIPLTKFVPHGTNDGDTAYNKALNDMYKAENETNPAMFKAIGQPNMENLNVLVITHVAKRDAGRYWIKNLDHDISKSEGYIITGELTRNSKGTSGTEFPSNITDEELVPKDSLIDTSRDITSNPQEEQRDFTFRPN